MWIDGTERPGVVKGGHANGRPARRRARAGTASALLLLAANACFATSTIAQTPAAPSAPIVVQNLAPTAREEWCSAVVPFARGAVAELPDLHVEDCETVFEPFGARWPDGSLRHALCHFRTRLDALSERRFALRTGPGPAVDPARVSVPFKIVVGVRRDGRALTATPQLREVLVTNAARDVALFVARIPETGIVCELIVERYAGQEHLWVDFAFFFSDPTTEAMEARFDELVVDCTGLAFLPRHAGRFAMPVELRADGSRVVVLRNGVLGDGQGVRRSGVLVPPLRGDRSLRDETLRAAVLLAPLAATAWQDSGAFGPFGHVPEPPPWLQGPGLRTMLAQRHGRFVAEDRPPADPYRNGPHGLARNAAQSGDQADFGVVKGSVVAWSGLPSFLHELEASVLQEALRPVHCFEADGAPVEPERHPNWVVWSGRTHWHCDVSKDRLGKRCPEPQFEAHGWTGKDREHWSSNAIGAFALLTGKHWVRRELEHEARLFLAGQTTDPALSTSGPGAPRGAGRTLHAGCWVYLATGDERVAQRMRERIERIYHPCWVGRELPAERLRPFLAMPPDARQLDGKTPWWAPWQDALAVVGFAAAHRVLEDPRAGELADGLALNLLRHGWSLDGPAAPIVATAIRWQDDGVPPTPDELARGEKNVVVWSHGTAFSIWALPSVEVGRLAALRADDAALAERAVTIQRALRARRVRPADGGLDPLTEWDALR